MPPLSKTQPPAACLVCHEVIKSQRPKAEPDEADRNSSLISVLFECFRGKEVNLKAPDDKSLFCGKCETLVREWHDNKVAVEELDRRNREIKATLTGLILETYQNIKESGEGSSKGLHSKLLKEVAKLCDEVMDEYSTKVMVDKLGSKSQGMRRSRRADDSDGSFEEQVNGVTDDEEENAEFSVSKESTKTKKRKRGRPKKKTSDSEDEYRGINSLRRRRGRPLRRREDTPPGGRRSARKKEPVCIDLTSDEDDEEERPSRAGPSRKRKAESDVSDDDRPLVKRAGRGRPPKQGKKVGRPRLKPKDRLKGTPIKAAKKTEEEDDLEAKPRDSAKATNSKAEEDQKEDSEASEDEAEVTEAKKTPRMRPADRPKGSPIRSAARKAVKKIHQAASDIEEEETRPRRSPLKAKNYKEQSDDEGPDADSFYVREKPSDGSKDSGNSDRSRSPPPTADAKRPRGRPKKSSGPASTHSDSDSNRSPPPSSDKRPRGRPRKQPSTESFNHSGSERDESPKTDEKRPRGRPKKSQPLAVEEDRKEDSAASGQSDNEQRQKSPSGERESLTNQDAEDSARATSPANGEEDKSDNEGSKSVTENEVNKEDDKSDISVAESEEPAKRPRGRPKSKQNVGVKPGSRPRGRLAKSARMNEESSTRPRRNVPKRVGEIIDLSGDDDDSVPSSRHANVGSDEMGSASDAELPDSKKPRGRPKGRGRPKKTGVPAKAKSKGRGRPKGSSKKKTSADVSDDDDKRKSANGDDEEYSPRGPKRDAAKRKKYTEDADNSDDSADFIPTSKPSKGKSSKGKRGRPKKKRTDGSDVDEVTLSSDSEGNFSGSADGEKADKKDSAGDNQSRDGSADREWESLNLDKLIDGLDNDAPSQD